jgi:hypothetical protein
MTGPCDPFHLRASIGTASFWTLGNSIHILRAYTWRLGTLECSIQNDVSSMETNLVAQHYQQYEAG